MPNLWPRPRQRQLDQILTATDLLKAATDALVAGQGRTTRTLERIIHVMADQSALLNSVADGLRGLGPTISALLAENATLRTRNAELEGEEVAESAAATNVKTEYDGIAGLFTAEPSVPDVEPLPPVEPSAEPTE